MQAVQGICDRLGRYIAAYRPELVCAIPLALLVLFGCFSAPWWGYAILLAALAMSILLCNPFHVWDRFLPPRARILMAAGILIAMLPLSFYNVAIMAKVVLWGLAIGLWAIALWRRRLWLGLWRIKQSSEVDAVLAHLSHSADWQAGRAWENYGCRETRALLHQTLWAECNEYDMQRTYMPVYLLGYLHGNKTVATESKKTDADRKEIERQASLIAEQEAELENLRAANASLWEKLSAEQERSFSAGRYAKGLEQQIKDATLPQQDRDAAILAYVNEGHTCSEAGRKFGLSKSGAAAAAKRARAKENGSMDYNDVAQA